MEERTLRSTWFLIGFLVCKGFWLLSDRLDKLMAELDKKLEAEDE